jgi:hypothetical protein
VVIFTRQLQSVAKQFGRRRNKQNAASNLSSYKMAAVDVNV